MLPEKSSYAQYGGELQDYSPVEDPETDLSAEASNASRCDTSAMTRTATRAWVAFTVSGSTVTIASNDYDAVYGNDNTVKPVVVKLIPGLYAVTFPTSVVDARGTTHSVNLNVGFANIEDLADGYFANCKKIGANVFNIAVWSTQDGILADPISGSVRINLMAI